MSQEKVIVFVEVSGGVVQEVSAPSFVDVQTIDWDNFRESPVDYWAELDKAAQDYLTRLYPDDLASLGIEVNQ